MARTDLTTLVATITATIPDNVIGAVSPADVRNMLIDTIQSLQPAYAFMWGDHTSVPIVRSITSGSWHVLAGADLYTDTGVSDVTELPADPATGQMAVQFADFVHTLRGSISVSGPNGRELSFTVGHDGVPIDGSTIITLQGAAQRMSAANEMTFIGRTGWDLQLLARFTDGGATANINIYTVDMGGSLQPTRTAD